MSNNDISPKNKSSEYIKTIFSEMGVPIFLNHQEDFLKVAETLQRVGIISYNKKTEKKELHQICYILHKKGSYAILHYKELLLLDGKAIKIEKSDIADRNKIANLLSDWNLIELADSIISKNFESDMSNIKVIKNVEKKDWILFSKYPIGKNHKKYE